MTSATKICESFPISQFLIDGYSSSYRLDGNKHGGCILVYFKNKIPTKPCLLEQKQFLFKSTLVTIFQIQPEQIFPRTSPK